MSGQRPRLTIGMPVYNGANYLAETLDLILSQTFTDFELLISDNASTDSTGEICRAYAARDSRIHYQRLAANLGAARNFNRLVDMARGDYFKWAAHDDRFTPDFVERCIAVLDREPDVVLCFARAQAIDEHGYTVELFDSKQRLASSRATERFYECINVPHAQTSVFGVIRTSILRQTRLIGAFSSSDRVLLGELTLLGRFYEISDILFFYRHHEQQSWRAYWGRHRYLAWFDPNKAGKISFPHWRLLLEHYITISRAPVSTAELLVCLLYLCWWVRLHWRYLLNNLLLRDDKFEGFQFLRLLALLRAETPAGRSEISFTRDH
jgi:glycosyltransferase involved in cell wall biosynthesis